MKEKKITFEKIFSIEILVELIPSESKRFSNSRVQNDIRETIVIGQVRYLGTVNNSSRNNCLNMTCLCANKEFSICE